jgi:anaerobic sulfite reductase subunit B
MSMASLQGDMVPAPFRVAERRQETADTWTLELEPRLEFEPGQFTMLAAGGAGEVPISISGNPEGGRLVHTVRAVGAATRAICAAEPGRALAVRGPFGMPWPTEAIEGADVVIVAGGIGLAPLRPAILRLLARPERYGRVTVLHGARTPDQLLFPDQLERWGAELIVDSAAPGWDGRVGVVTKLIDRAPMDPGSTVALLCGPEVMMRFAVPALGARGVTTDRTYVSLERNMQCGIGHCGHCQLGPTLICRDGPVYRCDGVERWLGVMEL